MKNFIEPALLDLDEVILLDVRFNFLDSQGGRRQYEEGHLKGAWYLDLERDLSAAPTEDSGNHPLPGPQKLSAKLEGMGALNDSQFVVYDDGTNSTAGRAWFVLKYFGLERVMILNGGLPAALRAGLQTTSELPRAKTLGRLKLSAREDMVASYEEVLAQVKAPCAGTVLIDSRSKARFQGLEETLYAIPGHIPGSCNLFYSEAFDQTGRLLPEEALWHHFASVRAAEDRIVSCGSGVTAAANLAALDEIGLNARLYVGSYSQWLKKGNRVE